MSVVYHITEEELNENFFQSLRAFVKGKKNIRIEVGEELTETEYLLSSEANRKMLLKSLKQAEKREN
jgi:intracellular sulfur oxidation DsrE/DsrF family protein